GPPSRASTSSRVISSVSAIRAAPAPPGGAPADSVPAVYAKRHLMRTPGRGGDYFGGLASSGSGPSGVPAAGGRWPSGFPVGGYEEVAPATESDASSAAYLTVGSAGSTASTSSR